MNKNSGRYESNHRKADALKMFDAKEVSDSYQNYITYSFTSVIRYPLYPGAINSSILRGIYFGNFFVLSPSIILEI